MKKTSEQTQTIDSLSQAIEKQKNQFWSDVMDRQQKDFEKAQKQKTPQHCLNLPENKTLH